MAAPMSKDLYMLSNAKVTDDDILINQLLQELFKMSRLVIPLSIFSNHNRLSEYVSDLNNLLEYHYKFLLTYASKDTTHRNKTQPKITFARILDVQDNTLALEGRQFIGLPEQYPIKFTSGIMDLYLLVKSMHFAMIENKLMSQVHFDIFLHGSSTLINQMTKINSQFKQLV